jgi:hypothetical protein
MLRNHQTVRKAFGHNSGPKMACPAWVAGMTSVQMGLVLNREFGGVECG